MWCSSGQKAEVPSVRPSWPERSEGASSSPGLILCQNRPAAAALPAAPDHQSAEAELPHHPACTGQVIIHHLSTVDDQSLSVQTQTVETNYEEKFVCYSPLLVNRPQINQLLSPSSSSDSTTTSSSPPPVTAPSIASCTQNGAGVIMPSLPTNLDEMKVNCTKTHYYFNKVHSWYISHFHPSSLYLPSGCRTEVRAEAAQPASLRH